MVCPHHSFSSVLAALLSLFFTIGSFQHGCQISLQRGGGLRERASGLRKCHYELWAGGRLSSRGRLSEVRRYCWWVWSCGCGYCCCCYCSAANKCLVKVAILCSNMQRFDKAAGLFEEVSLYSTLQCLVMVLWSTAMNSNSVTTDNSVVISQELQYQ